MRVGVRVCAWVSDVVDASALSRVAGRPFGCVYPPPSFADSLTGICGAFSGLFIFVASFVVSFVYTVSQSLLKPETRHLLAPSVPASSVLSPMLSLRRTGHIKPLFEKGETR